MRHALILSAGALCSMMTVAGIACAKPSADGLTRAQVITMLPKPRGEVGGVEPKYEIKEVTFKYLEDMKTLSGKYYDFRSGGTLTLNVKQSRSGEVTVDPVESGVSAPELYFEVKDGVVIPKDNYSLFILSTAYQLDHIFSKTKELIGTDPDELLKLKGKVKVYFDSKLVQASGRSQESLDANNAAFAPHIYSFIALKTNRTEKVPLSANLNVMAHEFGHLLFEYLTTEFDSKSALGKITKEAETVLSGLNEGFADLTAYTLTGNTNALTGSLESVGSDKLSTIVRQRDFSKVDFDYSDASFSDGAVSFSRCDHGKYCIGTLFDHAYYTTQLGLNRDVYDFSDRLKEYQELADAMKAFRDPNNLKNIRNSRDALTDYIDILLGNLSSTGFSTALQKNLKTNFLKAVN
jgi:hypothetical protein